MTKFHFSLAIDSIMMIMCVMLVISAAMNEHIYDSAATFKQEGGSLRASPKILWMNVDDANKLSNVVTILGSTALGMYALSLAQKGKGGAVLASVNKAPGITTAIAGFSVAIALIISGVVAHGIYDEIATFKNDKVNAATKSRDASNAFIALGSIIPVLYTVKFVWDKKGRSFRRFVPRGIPRPISNLTGGISDAASVFFTY